MRTAGRQDLSAVAIHTATAIARRWKQGGRDPAPVALASTDASTTVVHCRLLGGRDSNLASVALRASGWLLLRASEIRTSQVDALKACPAQIGILEV